MKQGQIGTWHVRPILLSFFTPSFLSISSAVPLFKEEERDGDMSSTSISISISCCCIFWCCISCCRISFAEVTAPVAAAVDSAPAIATLLADAVVVCATSAASAAAVVAPSVVVVASLVSATAALNPASAGYPLVHEGHSVEG